MIPACKVKNLPDSENILKKMKYYLVDPVVYTYLLVKKLIKMCG